MEIVCANRSCSVSFVVPDYPNVGSDRKYCSPRCKRESRRAKAEQRVFMPGDRFTRLVLVEPQLIGNRLGWKCQCDCGRECVVRRDKLRSSRVKSCGCLHTEAVQAAKADKAARERLRLQQSAMTYGLIDEKKAVLRNARQNKKRVLDYHNFDSTGTPRRITKQFQEWVFMVCDVLKLGPDSDRVTIKTNICIQQDTL